MRFVLALAAIAALPAGTALAQTPASTTTTAAENPDNRMICKTFAVTGSLVRTTRVCKEKHYWDLDYAIRRQTTATSSCGAEGGVCNTTNGFFSHLGDGTPSPQ